MTLSTPFLAHPCVLGFRVDRGWILSFGEGVRVFGMVSCYQLVKDAHALLLVLGRRGGQRQER